MLTSSNDSGEVTFLKKSSSRAAGLILAGGQSLRMGRCKATLPVGDSHVLGVTLNTLQQAGLSPVVVVSGFYHDEIKLDLVGEMAPM